MRIGREHAAFQVVQLGTLPIGADVSQRTIEVPRLCRKIRRIAGPQVALPVPGGENGIEEAPLRFVADAVEQPIARLDIVAVIACPGLFPQAGPYFPVVELQARWVADVWAGLAPAPSKTATPVAANTEPVRRREPRAETARAMALRFA